MTQPKQTLSLDGAHQWHSMPDMYEIRCPLPPQFKGDYDIVDSGTDRETLRARLEELRKTAPEGGPYTLHRIVAAEAQLPD